VATGTLIAEYVAAAIGIAIALRHMRGMGAASSLRQLLEPGALKRTFGVNRDIMIRTMALIAVFVWFASQGARQGDVILAANAILLQFISVSAYFLDGLAFATEALVGQAIGAGRRAALFLAVKMTTAWAAGVALLMSVVLAVLGPWLIAFLTVDPAARAAANTYLPWAAGAPLLGVWAFQLDGIFIGATHTVDMRNAMLASLAIFFGACWLLTPFGNHGLWAAFYVQYLARSATLLRCYPRIVRSLPASTSSTAGVRQPLRTPQK
jgi:MATE family multidrug resistance protein